MKVTRHSLYFTSIITISFVIVGGMLVSSAFSAPSSFGNISSKDIEVMQNYDMLWSPTNSQSGDTLDIIVKLPSWETESIIFRIVSPIGNIVSVNQIAPDYDGFYKVSFQLDGKLFKKSGTYRIELSGATTHTVTFEFEFMKKDPNSKDSANQTQRDNPQAHDNNELLFLGIIMIPIVIVILIILVYKNTKSKTPSSTAVPSSTAIPSSTEVPQEENITDIDKQIAINEEKIRKMEEESKRLDDED